MREVEFNPISKSFRSEIGGVVAKAPQIFHVHISKKMSPVGVHFCVTPENHSTYNILMQKTGEQDGFDIYSCEYTFLESGLYWYSFSFWDGSSTVYISKDIFGMGKLSDIALSWQMTVCEYEQKSIDWFVGSTMYQIFPDRFNRAGEIKVREGGKYHENWLDTPYYKAVDGKILNDDFFGGNFEGVIEKLDYLESLNVGVIYFNPICEAESNHKYDTSDFEKVDEGFGGKDKFILLLQKCHERGIKVILDGVFNHVGENSKYFNKSGKYPELGAYQSKDSKYYSWFSFDEFPHKYVSWWGIELLPALKENSATYIEYIAGDGGVIEKWLGMGIDGIRLDVVDELSNELIDAISTKVKKDNPSAILIGEVWEDASNKIAYGERRHYFSRNQLDSVMNYPWKNAIIDFVKYQNSVWLYSEIVEIVNNYPRANLNQLMNILSTHDTERILTTLAGRGRAGRTRDEIADWKLTKKEREEGFERLKFASLLQFTLPGVPSIYYGDEIGMEGYGDPFNRRCYPWGFEDEKILSWYKTLCKIREFEEVRRGDIELLPYSKNVIAYKRKSQKGEVLVVVNLSDEAYQLGEHREDIVSGERMSEVPKRSLFVSKN